MTNRIKKLLDKNNDLDDRVFGMVAVVGFFVVTISAIVTYIENLGAFATLSILCAALIVAFILVIYYKFNKHLLAKTMFCYLINCLVMPVVFFTCGGIDSGMPMYIVGGLFLVFSLLQGKNRLICFIISLIVDIITVYASYTHMEGYAGKVYLSFIPLAKLDLKGRIIDVISSLALVSIFMFLAVVLILSSYQNEKKKSEKLLDKLHTLSIIDELTGLYNRRELFNKFEEKLYVGNKDYYIAMFDVDHFKSVNDTYGHIFGDIALKNIAKELAGICNSEKNEIAARYGGEEFVLIIHSGSFEEALARIELLLKKVENLKWEGNPDLSITISGGLSPCDSHENLTNMLSKVDSLLYEAKHSGRNKVCY